MMIFDEVIKQFPQLQTMMNHHPLVYLDNGATTLKPLSVIQSLTDYYSFSVANVHRGIHSLSENGTIAYENVRKAVAEFINAEHDHEIIFTKGTTDSFNLLAHSLGESVIGAGDEIIISTMEHHSNFVPWQMMALQKGAKIIELPISDEGEISLEVLQKIITPKTKILSLCHVSNTLGTINPIKEVAKFCRQHQIIFCVDAAQSIAHLPVDVRDLDCDFLAFSAHKLYGPNGVGILYGKEDLLNRMPPYQGGGAMISKVSFEQTTYNNLPFKFEAGTPVIAEVLAFKASLKFVQNIGYENIVNHEQELMKYAHAKLSEVPGLTFIGRAKNKASVISFVIKDIHPHDLGTLLNQQGIAIRTGHHCTQALMQRFNIDFACRISFGVYNTIEEIDYFIKALHKSLSFLK